jgi:transcriptional regulator with XRE-family HTH domain
LSESTGLGLSHEEVAERADIDTRHVGLLEQGKGKPTIDLPRESRQRSGGSSLH